MNAPAAILGTFARIPNRYPPGEEIEATWPGTGDVVFVYVRDGRITGARILGDLLLQPNSLRIALGDEWVSFGQSVWDRYDAGAYDRDTAEIERRDALRAG